MGLNGSINQLLGILWFVIMPHRVGRNYTTAFCVRTGVATMVEHCLHEAVNCRAISASPTPSPSTADIPVRQLRANRRHFTTRDCPQIYCLYFISTTR